MDIVTTPKTYLVRCWDITLNSGVTANFALREDLGDRYTEDDVECVFTVPREKRAGRIMKREIAAVNYHEIEQKELPKYVPKEKRDSQVKTPAA